MRRASGCLPITVLPRKASAVEREQHRGLPLDEALVVQQQGRRAQRQHHARRDDVHGLVPAGAAAVREQHERADEHERGGRPVNDRTT